METLKAVLQRLVVLHLERIAGNILTFQNTLEPNFIFIDLFFEVLYLPVFRFNFMLKVLYVFKKISLKALVCKSLFMNWISFSIYPILEFQSIASLWYSVKISLSVLQKFTIFFRFNNLVRKLV